MDYYRQPQQMAHAGQSTPQNYMYQQATSTPTNSGVYYQAMSGYPPQQGSPYTMQPSVSQGAMVGASPVSGGGGGMRRGRDGAPVIHPGMHAGAKKDEIPLRMVVDSKFVGAIIGQQGTKIREISRDSNARCIVDAPKGSMRDVGGSSTEKCIIIQGAPESQTKAVQRILEVVEAEKAKDKERDALTIGDGSESPIEKEYAAELKLRVHNRLVGRLIGKQGATIKKIMAETDTTIFVSNDATQQAHQAALSGIIPPMYADVLLTERTITVRAATIAAISAAEQRISSKLRQSYESDLSNPQMYGPGAGSGMPMINPAAYGDYRAQMQLPTVYSFKSVKMFVPNNMVGAIIGSKGTHIRNIIRTTGVNMRVEGNERKDGEKREAEEKKEEESSPEKKEDEKKSDGDEDEKRKEEEERLITMTGHDQQIYRAQYLVFAKVAEQQAHYIEEVKLKTELSVPSKLVGRIIGKGGQNVRELQRVTGAHVKIAEEGGASDIECEEKKEGDASSAEGGECPVGGTVVRVTGNVQATIAVETRIAALIAEYNRSESRPNGGVHSSAASASVAE